jgi:hypothetical protein
LNEHVKKQRRISLGRLLALKPARCAYADLRRMIGEVELHRVGGNGG